MKFKLIVLILIIEICVFIVGCVSFYRHEKKSADAESSNFCKGIIVMCDHTVYQFDVENYTRLPQGGISVKATDGRIFYTDQKNVLIIEKKENE